jgi:hypothetical protein
MNDILERGTRFIWENARLLDRAIFDYTFRGGSPDHVLAILHTYQNSDGGFGHAIEPDLRAPDSQVLFVEFALRTLYECNLHDPEMVYRACDFIAQHADLKQGIPTLFPSAKLYPRADHMSHSGFYEPSFDRLTGLVGLILWQGIQHPWLPQAVEACMDDLRKIPYTDAHTIQNAFCLIESLSREQQVDGLFTKLSDDLFKANFFCLNAPVNTYCLTPLTFAPTPNAFLRRLFTDAQIDSHLDDLAAHQETDGGWSILWRPPGEMARREWRASKTVAALVALRAYGRI